MIRIYTYKSCDSCRKATKWLKAEGMEFEELAIRDTPPSKEELVQMLGILGGELRLLFNTSGRDYRELGLKDQVKTMSFDDAAVLLMENGNLVKRPFLLGEEIGLVGFKEDQWAAALQL